MKVAFLFFFCLINIMGHGLVKGIYPGIISDPIPDFPDINPHHHGIFNKRLSQEAEEELGSSPCLFRAFDLDRNNLLTQAEVALIFEEYPLESNFQLNTDKSPEEAFMEMFDESLDGLIIPDEFEKKIPIVLPECKVEK